MDATEQLTLGHVTGDFIARATFAEQCQMWLRSDRVHHVVTLNPEMVMQAETNVDFRHAVAAADVRVPDGAGLVWAQWYIRSRYWSLLPSLLAFPLRAVERITGVDTVYLLAELCAEHQQPLYLLGGTPPQVECTAARLRVKWPTLKITTSPDHAFDLAGPADILHHIQQHRPAVLLVAYGSPQQTLWIERHRPALPSVRIAVGVGGAFAILSEDRPRAPQLLRRLNLEWLWRLLLEPQRLPRIYQATVRFPLLIRRQKLATPPTLAA